MKTKSILLTLFLAMIFLASCGGNPTVTNALRILNRDAEREGNPYRYKATEDGNGMVMYVPDNFAELKKRIDSAPPTSTIADTNLQKDLLKAMGSVEEKKGGSGNPKLLETRALDKINEYNREVWVIDRNGTAITYLVTLKIVATGGTDYKIYPLE